jgi:hypothetical protein
MTTVLFLLSATLLSLAFNVVLAQDPRCTSADVNGDRNPRVFENTRKSGADFA